MQAEGPGVFLLTGSPETTFRCLVFTPRSAGSYGKMKPYLAIAPRWPFSATRPGYVDSVETNPSSDKR